MIRSLGTLLITLAIELPLVALLTRDGPRVARGRGRAGPDLILLALLLNLTSQPIGSLLVQDLGWPWFKVEIGVVMVEGAGYAYLGRLGWRRGLGLSFMVNLVTAALSFVV